MLTETLTDQRLGENAETEYQSPENKTLLPASPLRSILPCGVKHFMSALILETGKSLIGSH